jgi:CcmD family protein
MKQLATLLVILITTISTALAQEPEMADTMRSNGLIYVVVGVLSIVFLGIVIYLVRLDKKATALENELNALKK